MGTLGANKLAFTILCTYFVIVFFALLVYSEDLFYELFVLRFAYAFDA